MMKSSLNIEELLLGASFENTSPRRKVRLSRKTQWGLYLTLLVANDLLMMIAAFQLAYWIRFTLPIPFFRLEVIPYFPTYSNLVLILVPLWLAIFSLSGLYQRANLLGGTAEYSLVFGAITKALLVMIFAGFLEPTFVIARAWLLLFWILAFVLTGIGRFISRRFIYRLRAFGYFLSPAIIVGANEEGLSLARQFLSAHNSGLQLVGFVDKKFPAGTLLPGNLCVLGAIDQLGEIIKQQHVEEVILASSAFSSRDHMLEIFKRYGISNGVTVRMSSGLYEIITTGLSVREFAYVPLVGINKVRLTGIEKTLKMTLDYLVTIPGLILLSPIFLIIAILIKYDSPGPILHRRQVMGVNGTRFNAFKFRTMYINGDQILAQHPELKAELESTHKLKDDPRITPLGKALRKLSLDELPQLFNVVRQEMSLVGPRMISPEEMQEYKKMDINLLTVKPGITGLWQVMGRSDICYSDRVLLDMHYIRNWNIWMDLQLLVQTLPAVLRSRGAY
jgi:exopolysaccharide biosynthesis polyprenyl glycosylphosphotransferase